MKSILIIGAGGFIGSAISERLRKEEGRMSLLFGTSSSGRSGLLALDVTDLRSVEALKQWLKKNEVKLGAIIYAAGDCKPGGFYQELTTAKQDMDPAIFKKKSNIFGLGFMHVGMTLFPAMEQGGHIVVISSTNEAEKPPYYLSDRLYGPAISAQEALISTMREDEKYLVRWRDLHIHRIAPGAVEGSPFYEGTPSEMMPKRMVSVSVVAEAVVNALKMTEGHSETDFTEG